MLVALGIQHAMRKRRIVICGLSDCTIFFILTHKRHDSRKKDTEHKMCVVILFTNFIRTISHSKKK